MKLLSRKSEVNLHFSHS